MRPFATRKAMYGQPLGRQAVATDVPAGVARAKNHGCGGCACAAARLPAAPACGRCRLGLCIKRHPVKLSLKRFTGCHLVTGSWPWPLRPRRVICRAVSLCRLFQVVLWRWRCRIVCRAGSCPASGRLCRLGMAPRILRPSPCAPCCRIPPPWHAPAWAA